MTVRTQAAARAVPPPARRDPDHQVWVVLLAAVLSGVVPLVQLLDVSFPGRSWLALGLFALVPGAPLVSLLRLRSFPLNLAMTFAVSLSSLLLLSTILVKAPFWHPVLITLLTGGAGLLLSYPALRTLESAHWPTFVAPGRDRLIGLGLGVVSLALWVVAVSTADLDKLGGLGLAARVGPAYWVALVLAAGVFAWQLCQPAPDRVLMVVAVVLVVVEVFGFLNAADSAASLSTGWLHVGFAQYITDHGHVAHDFDARFSWPAFFASTSVLVKTGGAANAIPFLAPAHVVNLLLVLPGLWSIAHTITRRVDIAWLSLFVYLSVNWYEQDYFSPQAAVYVLYIGVLALLLHLAPAPQVVDDRPWLHPFRKAFVTADRPEDSGPGLQLAREAMLLLVCGAVVVSHQLTPLNLMMILVVLVITGATRMRGLWLLVTISFIAYFTFGAKEYWESNIGSVFGDVGQLGSTVNSAVGSRLNGDPLHSHLQSLRLAWAAASVLIALWALWTLRSSTWFWVLAGCGLGPFFLIAVQSYGGEVALRCFLYADPVLAPLVALVLWRLVERFLGDRPARLRTASVGLALVLGISMLTLLRGVNASFERETSSDISASGYIFDHVSQGDVIGTLQQVGFAGFRRVTVWTNASYDPATCGKGLDVEPCVLAGSPQWLLVTGSMTEYGVLTDGEPADWTDVVVQDLVRKGVYTVVYHHGDAQVLKLVGS